MSRHRVLVRVEENRGDELDVVIPSWSPDAVLTIPTSLLGNVPVAEYLLAEVNLSADFANDLEPDSFESAPEPADL